MKTNYVLIDFENVQPASIAALDAAHFHVIVFCGANQTKVPLELATVMQKMGSRARYLQISGNGSNALDFHIAFYIGELSNREPEAFFHIISKDTGFDPLIAHLKSRKILAARSKAIADMPIFKAAAAVPASRSDDKPPEPTPPPATPPASPSDPATNRVMEAVKDLIRRGNSRPRTIKTLSSTLQALFNKKLSDGELSALIEALASRKQIVIDGSKVSYSLKAMKG